MERPGERTPRASNRISRRVLGNWERVVSKAMSAEVGRASFNLDRASASTGAPYTVPQSLAQQANIEAVMQAADEIEGESLQVARILCEHAFRLTQQLDPTSDGRGVLQFKTGLKSIIKQKQQARQGDFVDRSQDIRIVQEFYKSYRERHNIERLEAEDRMWRQGRFTGEEPHIQDRRSEKMRRVYEISRILNDVVDALLREAEPEDASRLQYTDEKRVMEEDAKKVKEFRSYNILPLETPGILNPFQYFPEVTGATEAFRYTPDLPRFPTDYLMPEDRILDLFDFLHYSFGFQKDNVANQREHLILLLASARSRIGPLSDHNQEVDANKLADKALHNVHDRILENYVRWCYFLLREPQSKRWFEAPVWAGFLAFETVLHGVLQVLGLLNRTQRHLNGWAFTQQRKLCLTALYLLVWGEAANLRFMPECLCYIFHNMADECFDLLERRYVEKARWVKANADGTTQFSFLEQIITPVYNIVAAEAKNSDNGKAAHSVWRNYDDFNEFFWQPSCFELSWPWRTDAGFFMTAKKRAVKKALNPQPDVKPVSTPGRRREHKVRKINFVEHRSGFHLYHSFHRLWIFLVCMLQSWVGILTFLWAMGPFQVKKCASYVRWVLTGIDDMGILQQTRSLEFTCANHQEDHEHWSHIRHHEVYAIFVALCSTFNSSVLAVFDVVFMWGAFKSTRLQTVARMLLRFLWFASLSGGTVFLYVKTLQEDARNNGSTAWFKIFYITMASYAGAQLLFTFVLRLPWLRKQADKCTNVYFFPYFFQFIKWLHQERYYVGRGMYERMRDYVNYSLFWIFILACKFTFTMHFQIMPLVEPTRLIVGFDNIKYRWHDDISSSNHNALTILALWAPVVMIYFLDTQVWYTVTSALLGGIEGARDKLGEIRTLDMLRKRFTKYPEAFVRHMQPTRLGSEISRQILPQGGIADKAIKDKADAIRFQPIWNAVIKSLREEDLINNREKDLLKMPRNKMYYSNGAPDNLVQYPLFLLANKVHIAVEFAAGHKQQQDELWEKVRRDEYMAYAVQETFHTLEPLLLSVLNPDGRRWVNSIFGDVKEFLGNTSFVSQYKLSKLRDVLEKLRDLTEHLANEDIPERRTKATTALYGLYEVVMTGFLSQESSQKFSQWDYLQQASREGRLFSDLNWPDKAGRKQAKRLNNLLAVQKIKDSEGKTKTLNTATVPHNLEARRRLQFFTNSLFMHMPPAPPIRKMFSFCVFTPYYEEDVMYDMEKLNTENEDGITILFYLQKIYPDEWQNFLERIGLIWSTLEREMDSKKSEQHAHVTRQLRLWASYRGQTLARTVRGMMYYKKALEIQGAQEGASTADLEEGIPSSLVQAQQGSLERSARAQADLKFTYVVTCQIYGEQKKKGQVQAADILYLMQEYESLRIAFIDVVEPGTKDKQATYYSKLVKVDRSDPTGKDQEIYSIKLPGTVKLGEGKPENQNHAIIFTRGDCIQTIDMNQDNFMEEAFKVRNLLEEFDQPHHGLRRPTILGVREHVFTGSVSSLAWFMSMQESSFVTLGQRVLARPLKVRMHYGHPDVFDRIFHISRGGISKASRVINLSEDIFAGFNTTLRQGNVTHHEYIEVGKGRDVGLNQIALFEAKVASGNGEQSLSRDVYRLGQLLDFPRLLSFFYTSIGFYVTTMMTVLTLYVFLYGKAYLALSGVDASLKANNNILQNASLQSALNTQFLFQIGIFTAVPMIVNLILEQGILKAIISFCTMQLQLASVFFTFSLGTRTHYFGRTILHGGAKYRSTGRGFVVRHIKFAENYRLYSRSHFTKGLEIIMLLIVYLAYGAQNRSSVTFILLTFSSWFLALSWLYAPYIFNPSGFEWQKTVEDFDDWTNWLFYKGGVGVKIENSWESWWIDEQDHIRSYRGRFWEFVLCLRFFLFQYGVVYSLHVIRGSNSILVYVYSWLVLVGLVIIFKVFTISQKASVNFQLGVRLFQGLLFLSLVAGVVVAIRLSALTVGDVFAVALALIPTGWGLLSIAIAFRPLVESMRLWKSVREIARVYDACMGMIIFIPIAFLSWFPFISTFQTRLVFNQAFSRGLEISLILAGNRPNSTN